MTESKRSPRWVAVLLGAVAFGVAHTQALHWYSNQHQYLLHGLAVKSPSLAHDWLANTLDPTPLFSAFVAAVPPAVLHGTYFALLMLYFVALVRLAERLPTPPPPLPFAALVVLVHAAVVRAASVGLTGTDYPWFLQCGVANQYVLGPAIQPSAYGVFLVAAVAAFAHGRLAVAAFGLMAACWIHATYLLPAALLTLGFQLVLIREGRWRAALAFGVALLVAVSPVVVYGLKTFVPSSPEAFAEAQRLFVEVRIPHHAVIARWFDRTAVAQMVWVALALALLWRSRLFWVLALPTVLAVALTLVQAATGSHTLALIFPWRVSAVLVPVATAIILARVAGPLGRVPKVGWVVLIVALAAGGVWVMATGRGYRMNDAELPLLEYVRDAGGDEVYLLPVAVPTAGKAKDGPAVPCTTFTPPPRPEPGSNKIAVDLQRFRLSTSQPIYVDFKSVPYKDAEVLEWWRRMQRCMGWYARLAKGEDVRDELRREGVTRVVAPASLDLGGAAFEQVYADPYYRVYRLR
ncbi:MAG: DUF6798 domain-containing protein [Gemmataceae bacterium]